MNFGVKTGFVNDAKGGIALMFGLLVPVLIGFTGLGVDVAFWLMERNKLQASTDTAAISAAHAVYLNASGPAVTAEAKKLLGKVYGASLPGMTMSTEHPPTAGAYKGKSTAVAVLADRLQPVFFLSLFGVKNVRVSTRSVAQIETKAEACLLALSPTLDKAIEISGSSRINIGCGIASNSISSNAVYLSGTSNTTTTGISSAGDIYQSSGAQLETNDGPALSHSQPITDPYGPEGRNLQVPKNPTACTERNLKINTVTALTPGRYCGGIDFTGGTTTFAPGVYIIDGGSLKANGTSTLIGNGVTFVLTGTGAGIAQLDINGGAQVSLQAPTAGTAMDGILFFQDPAGGRAHGRPNTLNGNATLNLSGALYFPDQNLSLSGGSASNMACLQAVAQKISISGNSAITGTCNAASGTNKIARTTIELVE